MAQDKNRTRKTYSFFRPPPVYASGGGGGGGGTGCCTPELWFSTQADAIFTTGSVLIRGLESENAAEDYGTDNFFYVSGSIGAQGTERHVSVFGGDAVVSGSLVAFNGLSGSLTRLPDGTSYLIAGVGIDIISASNGAITISSKIGGGDVYTDSFVDADLDPSSRILIVSHGLNAKYVNVSVYDENDKLIIPDEVIATSMGTVEIDLSSFAPAPAPSLPGTWHVFVASGNPGYDQFWFSTTAGSIYTSGSAAFVGPDEWGIIDSPADKGTDVFFYVSGSSGSIGGPTPGVALFGGDVVISGSLRIGTGSVTITSNDVQFSGYDMRLEKDGNDLMFYDVNNPGGLSLTDLYTNAGSPGSPTNSVQYNYGGAFRGSADFTYDGRLYLSGSFNQGISSAANGHNSHAEGDSTTTVGGASHAEGIASTASGDYAHAEGSSTTALGVASHAEGSGTSALADYSHVEGSSAITKLGADYSHAEGELTVTQGAASHAEGLRTFAQVDYSHAEGHLTTGSALYSHAEGYMTNTGGQASHAEGRQTYSVGNYSHAEGYLTTGSSDYSHVEGYLATIDSSSDYSHAEGERTSIIKSTAAHAEGYGTLLDTANYSHAEGYLTRVDTGMGSHAEGYGTLARGQGSHSEGYLTTASADYSHAGGHHTLAYGDYQTVIGRFNNSDSDSNTLFIIGNGSNNSSRSDAIKVRHTETIINNRTTFSNDILVSGTVTFEQESTPVDTTSGLETTYPILIKYFDNNISPFTDYYTTWGIGTDANKDLHFSYGESTSVSNPTLTSVGYVDYAVSPSGQMNFTGQHRSVTLNNVIDYSGKEGLIVKSVGTYRPMSGSSITINDAIPIVDLTTNRNEKSCFGVISDVEDVNDSIRKYGQGRFTSIYQKSSIDDHRIYVNSLGEGCIWVCNINGNLENGDYITTCEIPGMGMKQDDDLLHNYTVAKITCDCDFDLNSTIYRCEEFTHEGITYRRAFVGCTYHCG